VSAAITPGGVAGLIVAAGIEGRFDYLLCPRLVGEVADVLSRPKITRLVGPARRERFVADVLGAGREVDDPARFPAATRDPDDDYLLALSVEHAADYLVTGDRDLLDLTTPPVAVVRQRPFLELVGSRPALTGAVRTGGTRPEASAPWHGEAGGGLPVMSPIKPMLAKLRKWDDVVPLVDAGHVQLRGEVGRLRERRALPAPHGHARPHQLHHAERPRPRQEAVGARQHAPHGE
jgi:putative PIN family toxin of toxin-antitoxin system